MKFKILYIITIFLFAHQITGAQETLATLVFKDGTVLKGLAKVSGRHHIRYRKSKEAKAKRIHFSKLKKADIAFEEGIATFVYLPKKGKNNPKIYKQLVEGNVSLYFWNTGGSNVGYNAAAPGTFGGNRVVGSSFYIENYFIKRSQDDGLILFTGSTMYVRGYKKAVKKFFKDCPRLIEKVKNKEFKREQIVEIVQFYNNNCVN